MRTGVVRVRDIIEEGHRLTGGFHVSEDERAVARLRRLTCSMATVRDLVGGRGIFRGPIFKGNFVDNPELGEPYVSARDIVNADVAPDTYLSRRHGRLLDELRLCEGMILVTCSGMNLGKAIWSRPGFGTLVGSGDLIRIEPNAAAAPPGYLFAFLASRYGHAQIRKQIYGGHIKHVDPEHIASLSVPRFDWTFEQKIHDLVEKASSLRVEATRLLRGVAARFDGLVDALLKQQRESPRVGVVNASLLQRRMDAQFHDPFVRALRAQLVSGEHATIGTWCQRIFLPGIFKRIHVDDLAYGAPYYTGSTLFSLDPEPKGVLSRKTTLFEQVRMEEGTVLVQAFGQKGGLTGRAVWVGRHLAGATTTHMLVRLQAKTKEDTAYLFGFLQSQAAYRQIASLTYGGSIPHFDEDGIASVVIPLFSASERRELARDVVTSVDCRDDALDAERQACTLVEHAIEGGAK
ncbi:MAG: hypothetical protein JNK72_03910 [Myxococcales bacterium]|nr:hypothetical protein [Myxococcales bacterium]